MVWSHAIKKQENNKSYAINGRFLQYRSLLNMRPKAPAPGKSEVDVGGIERSGYAGISGSGIVGGGAQSAARSLDLERRRNLDPPWLLLWTLLLVVLSDIARGRRRHTGTVIGTSSSDSTLTAGVRVRRPRIRARCSSSAAARRALVFAEKFSRNSGSLGPPSGCT